MNFYMILTLIIFIAVIWLQVPPLIQKQEWRELTAYSIFMALGIIISSLIILRIPVPSPTDFIVPIFKPFSDLLLK